MLTISILSSTPALFFKPLCAYAQNNSTVNIRFDWIRPCGKNKLEKIYANVGDKTPLVLHGDQPSGAMIQESIKRGTRKINQNRNVRHSYHKFLQENAGKIELPKLQEVGVALYSQDVERLMKIVGSADKG